MEEAIFSNSLIVFIKRLFLLMLPFIGISIYYFYSDPFKILYNYENDSFTNYYDNQPYELNREIISTTILSKNRKKYCYNSFIMGSCESYVFHADNWKRYLLAGSEIFHYPAASETLYGITDKLKYLDKTGVPIENCLIILDISTFKVTQPRTGTIYVAHPDVSGVNKLKFQIDMFKNFFSNMFCLQYIDYKITGKIKAYMKNNFAIHPGEIAINERANEYYYQKYDKAIQEDSVKFYADKKEKFYHRDTIHPIVLLYPIIREKQVTLLKEMKEIFDKNKTNYHIVISPMYDQVAFNKTDLQLLQNVFEKNRIHNYSGINEFTQRYTNYYDNFHYKPLVANGIFEEIYKLKTKR
jgi:hypothetical protein